ncbi:MAG: type II toxin-antitoxin system RelE/ParE family toxin [Candidatus Micrarchaeota archaeon]
MSFEPRFSEEFAEDLNKLDKPTKDVATKIIKKIIDAPQRNKRLAGPLAGCLRERFLAYRIIYRVNEAEQTIDFVRLKKRDDASR